MGTSRRTPVHQRLGWLAVLVLICLGGAGLASAADRPHTEELRPELSSRADAAADPWLGSLLERMRDVEGRVSELSSAGRRLLIDVQLLRFDELDLAIADGAEANEMLAEATAGLQRLREAVPADVEPWRLGQSRRQQLSEIDAAIAAASALDATWRELAESARQAAALGRAIRSHDELVGEALRAGSEARWGDAVQALEQARAAREDAAAAGRVLASQRPTPAFDDWLAAHEEQDEALLALYAHIDRTGNSEGSAVERLSAAVDAVRAPVPTSDSALQQIISATGGAALAERLLRIEEARGLIVAALVADADDDQGQPTE